MLVDNDELDLKITLPKGKNNRDLIIKQYLILRIEYI